MGCVNSAQTALATQQSTCSDPLLRHVCLAPNPADIVPEQQHHDAKVSNAVDVTYVWCSQAGCRATDLRRSCGRSLSEDMMEIYAMEDGGYVHKFGIRRLSGYRRIPIE